MSNLPTFVRSVFERVARMEIRLNEVPQAERSWVMHFAHTVIKANPEQLGLIWAAGLIVIARYHLDELTTPQTALAARAETASAVASALTAVQRAVATLRPLEHFPTGLLVDDLCTLEKLHAQKIIFHAVNDLIDARTCLNRATKKLVDMLRDPHASPGVDGHPSSNAGAGVSDQ